LIERNAGSTKCVEPGIGSHMPRASSHGNGRQVAVAVGFMLVEGAVQLALAVNDTFFDEPVRRYRVSTNGFPKFFICFPLVVHPPSDAKNGRAAGIVRASPTFDTG